jgi:hypothetical protein
LDWNPTADNTIYSLDMGGKTIYAGGSFSTIGGETRNCIAALDATTGNALTWNPNADSIVRSLLVSGPTVYAGGLFKRIGGQSRNFIAALDTTTGIASGWNPDANSFVYSLAVSGTTVFVGGNFTNIGQGVGHPFFARFDGLSNSTVTRPIPPSSGLIKSGLQIINLSGSGFRAGAAVKFAYTLPKAGNVFLRLYSINGRLQSELINKEQAAGSYSITMQRGLLATGAYLVSFRAGGCHQEKMMYLMK